MDTGTQTGAGVPMKTSKRSRTQCQAAAPMALLEQWVPEISKAAPSPSSVAAQCCYEALPVQSPKHRFQAGTDAADNKKQRL